MSSVLFGLYQCRSLFHPFLEITLILFIFSIHFDPESRVSDRPHGNRYRGDQLMVDFQHSNRNSDLHQIISLVDEKMFMEEVVTNFDISKKSRTK